MAFLWLLDDAGKQLFAWRTQGDLLLSLNPIPGKD